MRNRQADAIVGEMIAVQTLHKERIPARPLRHRIHPIATRVLADLGEKLKPFYRETGRRSIDPELMLKMLIVGYCHGIRTAC
jgi:hypothetical protein